MHRRTYEGTRRGRRCGRRHHAPSITRACLSRALDLRSSTPPRRGPESHVAVCCRKCTHPEAYTQKALASEGKHTWEVALPARRRCQHSVIWPISTGALLQRPTLPTIQYHCTTRTPAWHPHAEGNNLSFIVQQALAPSKIRGGSPQTMLQTPPESRSDSPLMGGWL